MLITSSFYIVQFSRFALPTAFAARFEDLSLRQVFKSNNKSVVSVSRPPDEIRLYLALHARCNLLVGPSGLEPPTLRLSVVRSSQLSYGPLYRFVFSQQVNVLSPRVRRTSVLLCKTLPQGEFTSPEDFKFSRVPAKAYAFVGWWR